jgi:hypothetical protein
LTIFCEKIGVFLKNQYYDQNFAQFSFVLSQKRQFFAEFSAKIFLKIIITSIPGTALENQNHLWNKILSCVLAAWPSGDVSACGEGFGADGS